MQPVLAARINKSGLNKTQDDMQSKMSCGACNKFELGVVLSCGDRSSEKNSYL